MPKSGHTILVINPGSRSTRIAVYTNGTETFAAEIPCAPSDVSAQKSIADQLPTRLKTIEKALAQANIALADITAIAARGAPLAPVPGGTYRINEAMLQDARGNTYLDHASKLACMIADTFARHNPAAPLPAFVTDPVSVDEYEPLARISGLPGLERKCLTHALNIKAVARQFAHKCGRTPETLDLIVAHMGGGISIAALAHNRIIDSVDANGEGPMSAERSGGLRADTLIDLCFSGAADKKTLKANLTRNAGLLAHLGTADLREVAQKIAANDAHAALILQAMCYQIAKHCAALTVALGGKADAILLTGGMAHSTLLVETLSQHLACYAPIAVFPGENEMRALYEGTMRVLAGQEKAKIYPTGMTENEATTKT